MIAARDVPSPAARELGACGLAALGESGVVFLPMVLVLTESRGLTIGIGALFVPFVLAYVGGALLACRFRVRGTSGPAPGGASSRVPCARRGSAARSWPPACSSSR